MSKSTGKSPSTNSFDSSEATTPPQDSFKSKWTHPSPSKEPQPSQPSGSTPGGSGSHHKKSSAERKGVTPLALRQDGAGGGASSDKRKSSYASVASSTFCATPKMKKGHSTSTAGMAPSESSQGRLTGDSAHKHSTTDECFLYEIGGGVGAERAESFTLNSPGGGLGPLAAGSGPGDEPMTGTGATPNASTAKTATATAERGVFEVYESALFSAKLDQLHDKSTYLSIDEEEEYGRYTFNASKAENNDNEDPGENREQIIAPAPSQGGVGEDDGACGCSAEFIAKDFRGFDYSQYDAHTLYDHCQVCNRRPSAFMCLHCLESVCPSHVKVHHENNPQDCTLFVNMLDILTSFDRIFWCEKCKRFTWKYTEMYESLTDQIAATKGTYVRNPITDVFLIQYVIDKTDPATSPPTRDGLEAIATAMQGWRSGQEDAAAVFHIALPAPTRSATTSISSSPTAAARRSSQSHGASSLPPALSGQAPLSIDTEIAPSCLPDASSAMTSEYHIIDNVTVFCVFDGHGGDAVAKLAAHHIERHVHQCLTKFMPQEPIRKNTTEDATELAQPLIDFFTSAFREAILALDEEIRTSSDGIQGNYNLVGCTACLVAVTPDAIICASCGDSGAVLVTWGGEGKNTKKKNEKDSEYKDDENKKEKKKVENGPLETMEMIPLSHPHRLSSEEESQRIKKAGYSVKDDRIEGMLAVPRAIGDYDFKQTGTLNQKEQAVTAFPDVIVKNRPAAKWFIALACDGVWDTLPSDEVCSILLRGVTHRHSVSPGGTTTANNEDSPPSPPHRPSSPHRKRLALDLERVESMAHSFSGSASGSVYAIAEDLVDDRCTRGIQGVLKKCVADSLNDEGLGMDNVSLVLIHPR